MVAGAAAASLLALRARLFPRFQKSNDPKLFVLRFDSIRVLPVRSEGNAFVARPRTVIRLPESHVCLTSADISWLADAAVFQERLVFGWAIPER
jgi:hypothetical protein